VKNPNLIKHMLATEAVMKAVAREKGEDEEQWGLVGLLHDLDAEETTPQEHALKGAEILEGLGFSPEMAHAVRAHNGENNGEEPRTLLAKALRAVDQLTGLITASALVRPDKLATMTPDSVLKRFKEKRFAAGANREQIASCTEIGFDLPSFVKVGVEAMKSIREELDL
jgi:putative nucleotidyltransferase with HDIG domain